MFFIGLEVFLIIFFREKNFKVAALDLESCQGNGVSFTISYKIQSSRCSTFDFLPDNERYTTLWTCLEDANLLGFTR
jgi:hypothetical protein